MHNDLLDCIQAAKTARDRCAAGEISPKSANAIAANNKTIIDAHTLDLRLRMFAADTARAEIKTE